MTTIIQQQVGVETSSSLLRHDSVELQLKGNQYSLSYVSYFLLNLIFFYIIKEKRFFNGLFSLNVFRFIFLSPI